MWIHVSVSKCREGREWRKRKLKAAKRERERNGTGFLALGTPKPLIRPQITR